MHSSATGSAEFKKFRTSCSDAILASGSEGDIGWKDFVKAAHNGSGPNEQPRIGKPLFLDHKDAEQEDDNTFLRIRQILVSNVSSAKS